MYLISILLSFLLIKSSVTQKPDAKSSADDNSPQTRIAGGRSTHPGDVPYQLQLRHDNVFKCGATLTVSSHGNQVVLTSGQCVTDLSTLKPLDASKLTVVGGRVKINGVHPYEQTRQITKFSRHPDWKETYSYYYNDLAVLHIDKPFEVNRLVQSIDLIPNSKTKPTGDVVISGWGHVDPKEDGFSTFLQISTVIALTNHECYRLYYGVITAPINDFVFCAGEEAHPTYQGACKGDVGGPAAGVFNKSLYLVGIFDWGQPKCGNRWQPSIFTDLSYFLPWINAESKP